MRDASSLSCVAFGFLMGFLCGTCITMALMQRQVSLLQAAALEQGYAALPVDGRVP